MDEHRSISNLFEEFVGIAVDEDYFPDKTLAVLRRCNKTLKALVDPKLTTLTVSDEFITTFLGSGSTQTVENLCVKCSDDPYDDLIEGFFVSRKFLATPMPKLQNLDISDVSWMDRTEYEDDLTIGWTGLTSLRGGGFHRRALPNWISQLENLEELNLNYCPELVNLPHWITNLKALKKLEIPEVRFSNLLPALESLSNLTNRGT